jgi:hypothetical protein
MSNSLIACAIDTKECAIVRLKTSGSKGYSLSACKTLPFGLGDLASRKGEKVLKKLENHLNEWPDEELALCFGTTSYHPLPTSFPATASAEECETYCRIEAGYFLNQPEKYHYDCTSYGSSQSGAHEKKILFFYPAEPGRTATEYFSTKHRITFKGTSQQPLLHLSKFREDTQVIVELENNYMLLTISKDGRMEKMFCREIKNREEIEYFTIKALVDNPVCRETEVQVTGAMADKTLITLIQRETSITLKPLSIPPAIALNNPQKLPLSSSAAIKAISTALMALGEQKKFTLFSD